VQFPLDHVAIAVESIAAMLPTYEAMFGGTGSPVELVESQGVKVAFVGAGPGRLELLEPLSPDSPVGRFLERRGPGLHHIAYRVPDIRSELSRLAADGVELIDTVPRPGVGGHLVAFVHPRSAGGVLVELVEGS
jgi:methylmalonyl-CoA/ethylmalonyl-CoA epimerase